MKDKSKTIGTDEFWEAHPEICSVDMEVVGIVGIRVFNSDRVRAFEKFDLKLLGYSLPAHGIHTRPKVAKVPTIETEVGTECVAWDAVGIQKRYYKGQDNYNRITSFTCSTGHIDTFTKSYVGSEYKYHRCEIYDPEIHDKLFEEQSNERKPQIAL